MDPLTIGIIVLAGIGILGARKRRRTKREEEEELELDEQHTQLEFAADCSEWFMPAGWIVAHAEPVWMDEMEALVEWGEGEGEGTQLTPLFVEGDPEEWLIGVTYEILRGQLPPSCPEPIIDVVDEQGEPLYVLRFRELQTVVPDAVDYWEHAEAILGLYDHVFEAASNALGRVLDSGNIEDGLLFPVDEV